MRGVRFLAGAGQVGVEGWRPTSGRWPSSIPARSMIEGHRSPGARPAPDPAVRQADRSPGIPRSATTPMPWGRAGRAAGRDDPRA